MQPPQAMSQMLAAVTSFDAYQQISVGVNKGTDFWLASSWLDSCLFSQVTSFQQSNWRTMCQLMCIARTE